MHTSHPPRIPYTEPFRATITRTVLIALGLGTLLACVLVLAFGTEVAFWLYWLSWVSSVFWFSFGGHWVELLYLNVVRKRLPRSDLFERVARVMVWYAGGCVLFSGMKITMPLFGNFDLAPFAWWQGGFLFLVVECGVHTVLAVLKRGNFWNRRG